MKALSESILGNDLADVVDQNTLISALNACFDIPPSKMLIKGDTCYIKESISSIWNDDFFDYLASNNITNIHCDGRLSITTTHGISNFKIRSSSTLIFRIETNRPGRFNRAIFDKCEFKADTIGFMGAHFITLKNCELYADTTVMYDIDKPSFPRTKFECRMELRYNRSNTREIRRINKYLNLFDPHTIDTMTKLTHDKYSTKLPQLDIYKLLGTQISCDRSVRITMGDNDAAGFSISHSYVHRREFPSIKCKNGIWVVPIKQSFPY